MCVCVCVCVCVCTRVCIIDSHSVLNLLLSFSWTEWAYPGINWTESIKKKQSSTGHLSIKGMSKQHSVCCHTSSSVRG